MSRLHYVVQHTKRGENWGCTNEQPVHLCSFICSLLQYSRKKTHWIEAVPSSTESKIKIIDNWNTNIENNANRPFKYITFSLLHTLVTIPTIVKRLTGRNLWNKIPSNNTTFNHKSVIPEKILANYYYLLLWHDWFSSTHIL